MNDQHDSEERWILLVEDHTDLREIVSMQLEMRGFRVVQAESAQVALCLVSKDSRSYYALMTDFNMPRKSGLSLIVELENHRSRFRHRILMSGDPSLPKGFAANAESRGIHFLRKPFSEQELASFLEQLEKT